MSKTKKPRWKELLAATAGYEQVVVITHDNPDPDAIAAGWGVRLLLSRKSKAHVRLIGGGGIVRAENRHMLNLLKPPIELVHQFSPRKRTGAIFVDCTPSSAGHLASSEAVEILGVIDHHLTAKAPRLPFVDIRPRMAAAATMVAGYLRESGIKPSKRLATAMLYAVRTETCGNEFHHTTQDRFEIQWLTPFSNPEWLAEIYSQPSPPIGHGADPIMSLNMHLFPDDVRHDLVQTEIKQDFQGLTPVGFTQMRFDKNMFYLPVDYNELSPNGVRGDASIASSEVGAKIWSGFIDRGVEIIERFKQVDTRCEPCPW